VEREIGEMSCGLWWPRREYLKLVLVSDSFYSVSREMHTPLRTPYTFQLNKTESSSSPQKSSHKHLRPSPADCILEKPAELIESDSFHIVKIFIPVIITLRIDAIVTPSIEQTHNSVQIHPSFTEIMSHFSQDVSTEWSIYLVRIIIQEIFMVTTIALTLDWFDCFKILFASMIFPISLLLSFDAEMALGKVRQLLNISFN
jgi:hypothetical protein